MATPNPQTRRDAEGRLLVERFTPIRRAEHVLAIMTFLALVLTGFPQRFYDMPWAAWLVGLFGGVDDTRTIHRAAGYLFAAHLLLHLMVIATGMLTRRMRPELVPTLQDLRDAWENMAYYLGYREHPPALPKFDYRQKFEYLGIVLGGLVMVLTGLILLFPIETTTLLPGQVIPAARLAHSNEAMLALLVLVVWHVYGSHLSPEVFPMDRSIFTGYIAVDDLRERHAREYTRLFPDGADGSDRGTCEDATSGRADTGRSESD